MYSKSNEIILIRDRKGHIVTKKRDTCVDGSRDWSYVAINKECWDSPEAGRSMEHLDFRLLDSRNVRKQILFF